MALKLGEGEAYSAAASHHTKTEETVDEAQSQVPEPLQAETLQKLQSLLGSLVPGFFRAEDGSLNLKKIPAKSFEEFLAFLQEQSKINDGSWFTDPFARLIGRQEYQDLFLALYRLRRSSDLISFDPKALDQLLQKFEGELISINAERYVGQQMGSHQGRDHLRHILGDKVHFTKAQRGQVLNAIALQGKEAHKVLENHYEGIKNHTYFWGSLNALNSEDALAAATRGALALLQSVDVKEELQDHRKKHAKDRLEMIVERAAQDGLGEVVTRDQAQEMLVLAQEQVTSPLVEAEVHLAKLWLMVADGERFDAPELKGVEGQKIRRWMLGRIESSFQMIRKIRAEGDPKKAEALFAQFVELFHGNFHGDAHLEGFSKLALFQDGLRSMTGGLRLKDILEPLAKSDRQEFDAILQLTDRWHYSQKHGTQIFEGHRARGVGAVKQAGQVEESFEESRIAVAQELRRTQQELWAGYAQHGVLSQSASALAEEKQFGDRFKIRRAAHYLDAVIQRVEQAPSAEALQAELAEIYEQAQTDGILNQAFHASETAGLEALVQVLEVCLETLLTTALIRGVGALRAVKAVKDLKNIGQAAQAVEQAAGASRFAKTLQYAREAMPRAKEAFKLGMITSTEGMLLAEANDQAGREGLNLKNALVQGLSEGLSMALTGFLPEGLAGVREYRSRIEKFLSESWNFVKGTPAHFAKESIEEITSMLLERALKDPSKPLSEEEIANTLKLCFASGGLEARALLASLAYKPNLSLPNAPSPRAAGMAVGAGVFLQSPDLFAAVESSLASTSMWTQLWPIGVGVAATLAVGWMGLLKGHSPTAQGHYQSLVQEMHQQGFSLEQQQRVLEVLVDAFGEKIDDYHLALLDCIDTVKAFGWSPQQAEVFVVTMVKAYQKNPKIFSVTWQDSKYHLRLSRVVPDQLIQMIQDTQRSYRGDVNSYFLYVHVVMSALDEFSIYNRSQKLDLARRVVIAASSVNRASTIWRKDFLESLVPILTVLHELEWPFAESSDLIAHIKVLDSADDAFNHLPKMLRSLHSLNGGVSFSKKLLIALIQNTESNEMKEVGSLTAAISDLAHEGWSDEEKRTYLLEIIQITGPGAWFTFQRLVNAFEALKLARVDRSRRREVLLGLAQVAGDNAGKAYTLLRLFLGKTAPDAKRLKLFHEFLLAIKGEKSFEVLEALSALEAKLSEALGPYLEQHLQLYLEIFVRWPKYSSKSFQELLDATIAGVVPSYMDEVERQRLLFFIETMGSFDSHLFQVYLERGEPVLYKWKDALRRMSQDEISLKEIQQIKREDGANVLLSLLRRVTPPKSEGGLEPEYHGNTMNYLLKAGNLRKHVPAFWRGVTERFLLVQGGYKIKSGLKVDAEGHLGKVVQHLTQEIDPVKTPKPEHLQQVLRAYLEDRKAEPEGALFQALWLQASLDPALRAKAKGIAELNYQGLSLLQEMLEDRDELPRLLRKALEAIDDQAFRNALAPQEVQEPKRLLRTLEGLVKDKAEGQSLDREKRLAILGRILSRFNEAEIREKVCPHASPILQQTLDEVFKEFPKYLRQQVIDDLLSSYRQEVKAEKNKFVQVEAEEIPIAMRAVKGPGYVLHGICSGVCVYEDLDLWKDPNFKLIALIDERSEEAVGFIHVYEVTIRGKKYLTLPGVNPTTALVASVVVQQLYQQTLDKLVRFAELGDYAGIYLPTDKNISSNRGDIRQVIESKNYPKKNVPKVDWNTQPSPYPFNEVYVVWEKPRPVPSKRGPRNGLGPMGMGLMAALATLTQADTLWAMTQLPQEGSGSVVPKIITGLLALPFFAMLKGFLYAPNDEGESVGLGHDPALIQALEQQGFSPEQRQRILDVVVDALGENTQDHHAHLQYCLTLIRYLGWDVQQGEVFIKGLAKEVRKHPQIRFRINGDLARALIREKITPEQLIQMMSVAPYLLSQDPGRSMMRMCDMVNDIDVWSQPQKVAFVTELVSRGKDIPDKNWIGTCDFVACLSITLRKLNKRGWSYEECHGLVTEAALKSLGELSALESLSRLVELSESLNGGIAFIKKFLLDLLQNTQASETKDLTSRLESAMSSLAFASWGDLEKRNFMSGLVDAAGAGALRAFDKLGHALQLNIIAGADVVQQRETLLAVAKLARENTGNAYHLFDMFLTEDVPYDSCVQTYLEILTVWKVEGTLEEFNEVLRVALELKWQLGREYTGHLKLYQEIFKRWPLYALRDFNTLLQATQAGSVPSIMDEKNRAVVLLFIEYLRVFDPHLFEKYNQEGKAALLRWGFLLDDMLNDEVGPREIDRIRQDEGESVLLALLMRAVPPRLKDSQRAGLFRTVQNSYAEAGDLRQHVPAAWRGVTERIHLVQGSYKLKPGLSIDPDGKVELIVQQIAEGMAKLGPATSVSFQQGLQYYLASGRSSELARLELYKSLWAQVSQDEELLGKAIDLTLSYEGLSTLQEMLEDQDGVPRLIHSALEKIDETALQPTLASQVIKNPRRLLGTLEALANDQVGDQALTQEKRIAILSRILAKFGEAEVREKVYPQASRALQQTLDEIFQELSKYVRQQIVDDLLAPYRSLISEEKSKFLRVVARDVSIAMRAVKGPVYVTHALCSGVCIDSDIELWKKPAFKLMALIDEKTQEAVGFIHVFEVKIRGKVYLTLPGINPSIALVASVETDQLYRQMIEIMIRFAELGNYAGIYLPTDDGINSNRGDIRRVIHAQKYPKTKIPDVNWNTKPNPYPFNEVYVVWEKSKPAPSKRGPRNGLGPMGMGLLAALATLTQADTLWAMAQLSQQDSSSLAPHLLTGLLALPFFALMKGVLFNRQEDGGVGGEVIIRSQEQERALFQMRHLERSYEELGFRLYREMSWNAWIKAFLQLHPSDRLAHRAKVNSIPLKHLLGVSSELNSDERILLARRALELLLGSDKTLSDDALAVLTEVFPYFEDAEGRALAGEWVQRLSPKHPEFKKLQEYGATLLTRGLRSILPYLSMQTRVEMADQILRHYSDYQTGLSKQHQTRLTIHVDAWLEIFKQLDSDQQSLRVAQIKHWLQSLNQTGRLAVIEQFLPTSMVQVKNPFAFEPADVIFQTLLIRGVLDARHEEKYIISYDDKSGVFTFREKVNPKGWDPLNMNLGRKIRVQAPRRLKTHYLSTLLEYLGRPNEKGRSAFDRKHELHQPAPTEADPHPKPVLLDYIPLEQELFVELAFNPSLLALRLATYIWPDNPLYFETWRREFSADFHQHHPHLKEDVAFRRFIQVLPSASGLPALMLGIGAGLSAFFHEGMAEAALAFLNSDVASANSHWSLGFIVLGGVFAFLSRKLSSFWGERSESEAKPDLESVERFWQEGIRQFEQEEQLPPFRQEASIAQRRQMFQALFLDKAYDEYAKDRQGLRLWLAAQLEEKGLDDPRWLEGLPDSIRVGLAGNLAYFHIAGYQEKKISSWSQARYSLYKAVAYLNPTLDLTPIIAKEAAGDIELELLVHVLASDYLPYMSKREGQPGWLYGKGYDYFEGVKSLLNQQIYQFIHLSPELRYQNRTLGYYLIGQLLKHTTSPSARLWMIDQLIDVCDQNAMVQPIESLFGMLEGLSKDELQNSEVNIVLSLLGVSDPRVVGSVGSRTTLQQWVASVEFEARVDQLIAFYGALRWEEMYVRFYRGKGTRHVLPPKSAPRSEQEPNLEDGVVEKAQDPNQWSQQIGNLKLDPIPHEMPEPESIPSAAEEPSAPTNTRVASEPPPAVAAPPAQPNAAPEEWLDDDLLEEWEEEAKKKQL